MRGRTVPGSRRECERVKGEKFVTRSPKRRPVGREVRRRFPDVLARQRYGGLADLSDVEVPSPISRSARQRGTEEMVEEKTRVR